LRSPKDDELFFCSEAELNFRISFSVPVSFRSFLTLRKEQHFLFTALIFCYFLIKKKVKENSLKQNRPRWRASAGTELFGAISVIVNNIIRCISTNSNSIPNGKYQMTSQL
jgi:hypothetical protein